MVGVLLYILHDFKGCPRRLHGPASAPCPEIHSLSACDHAVGLQEVRGEEQSEVCYEKLFFLGFVLSEGKQFLRSRYKRLGCIEIDAALFVVYLRDHPLGLVSKAIKALEEFHARDLGILRRLRLKLLVPCPNLIFGEEVRGLGIHGLRLPFRSVGIGLYVGLAL